MHAQNDLATLSRYKASSTWPPPSLEQWDAVESMTYFRGHTPSELYVHYQFHQHKEAVTEYGKELERRAQQDLDNPLETIKHQQLFISYLHQRSGEPSKWEETARVQHDQLRKTKDELAEVTKERDDLQQDKDDDGYYKPKYKALKHENVTLQLERKGTIDAEDRQLKKIEDFQSGEAFQAQSRQMHEMEESRDHYKKRSEELEAEKQQLQRQLRDHRNESSGRVDGSNKRKRARKESVVGSRIDNQPLAPDGSEVAEEILTIAARIKHGCFKNKDLASSKQRRKWLAENESMHFTAKGKLRWLSILKFEMNNIALFSLEDWAIMVDDLNPHRRSDGSCWRDALPKKEARDEPDGAHNSLSGSDDNEEDGAEPDKPADSAHPPKPTVPAAPPKRTASAKPVKQTNSARADKLKVPAGPAKSTNSANSPKPTNSAKTAHPAERAGRADQAKLAKSAASAASAASTTPAKVADRGPRATPSKPATQPSEKSRPSKPSSTKDRNTKRSNSGKNDTDDLKPGRGDAKAGKKRGNRKQVVPVKNRETVGVVRASSINTDDEGQDASDSEKEETRRAFDPDNDEPEE